MTIVWWLLGVVAAAFVVLVGISTVWRWRSRQRPLPCPAWLAWSLEGRFVDWWTGTQRTLDRIGLRAGDRVLEVGPGPGRLLIPAADRVLPGGKVVGLDLQERMIQRLLARAGDRPNLAAQVGNAESMTLESDSFDVVFLCCVLGEIPNREAALAECFRVLRPGGRLSITEIMADPHFQSRGKVRQLAEAAGFVARDVLGRPWSFTANFEKPDG